MSGAAAKAAAPDWVLITGASRGIGRAAALSLAAAGYPVILWARTAADLADVSRTIEERWGTPVRTAVVDVADSDRVDEAAAESLKGIESLRGVVVNAGGGIWSSLEEMSTDDWRQVLGPNLDGAFHTLRTALPYLRRRPGSQIVGLASDSSYNSFSGRGAYCASKAGFLSLLETARRESRESGVRVTALVPSRVDTYFRGKQPGSRPEALTMAEVGEMIASVFAMPGRLEVREIQFSSITSSFGMFPEVYATEPTSV
ncbi:SDR family oxidoreductase [Streptomyces poriferorum]|uniref:SDR family NAD(P)-dependent oxidoreductase n=1 Tax=Streptomyces poriferorum TaxID=2798799 RepID=A0ABY9IGS0_9ACTN|nr:MULTISPECIES: SDR family NAD(P)-dependent oxidoreductase [unclassified Streptomyces]MDP5315753.1 SDR family NAD(P)-dependent oxidoreductase [Streptomyces sp. Alt4]WLQ54114.1 SDR family NAD(P)-dependent oxidoreductase [Streptomyces sp. Alt2]